MRKPATTAEASRVLGFHVKALWLVFLGTWFFWPARRLMPDAVEIIRGQVEEERAALVALDLLDAAMDWMP